MFGFTFGDAKLTCVTLSGKIDYNLNLEFGVFVCTIEF